MKAQTDYLQQAKHTTVIIHRGFSLVNMELFHRDVSHGTNLDVLNKAVLNKFLRFLPPTKFG